MAAQVENLLSLGHLTGTERNTLTKQREQRLKKSVNRPMMLQVDLSTPRSHQQLRAMQLQQRWQELKERELTAKQHNRQLLQQFEEAQDTLREMITLTAAMKTIRMEYEKYLEESAPRWKQQLKEKTQAAQKKRMEDYLRSCLKSTEEQVTESSADRPLLSQGATTMPQKTAAPPKHYSQNSHIDYTPPHLPYMQPSWQFPTQSQTARFPIRAPYQPQGSFHVLPSFLPPPHPFQPYPLTTTPTHHHPRPRQDPPGWASLQPDYPWSWAAGAAGAAGIPSGSEALWGQLYTEEPLPEMRVVPVVGEEADTSRAPSSKREREGGSRSSHLSQELDIKPVRLCGGHAESSESGRESSQVSREKRKKREKRGRSQHSSSDIEGCSSQESSGTSSAIIVAAVTTAQSSESDDSSVKSKTSSSRRTTRSGGLAVGSPSAEKVTKQRTRSKGDDSGSHQEESPSTNEELGSPVEESSSEKAGDQNPDDKSESCGEESGSQREEDSGSVSIKIENGDEMEKQESGSSEQSSVGEKDEEGEKHEEDQGGGKDDDGEEKEKSQTDEEQEERDGMEDDDDEASEGKNTTEEEEEHEKDLGDGCDDDGEEKENCQTNEEQEERERVKDDDEASQGKSTSDEEEATGAEDEAEEQESGEKDDGEEEHLDRLKNEDSENGKKGSESSQDEEADEDESEEDEDKMEEGESDEGEEGESDEGEEGESDEGEEGAGEDEEEQRGDEAGPEDENDSDDSIILPRPKSKKMHVIQEEASEDDEEEEEGKGSKTGSSDDDSNEGSDEDDVEHLLAPQGQSQKKEEKDLKTNEKPKAVCDNVMTFQVKPDKSTKSDHPSDSDEFDNFYG